MTSDKILYESLRCECETCWPRDAIANVVSCDYIWIMKTVGIRDLKAHLSRVLRDVAVGNTYLVTDRGRVVAELRPPDGAARAATPVQRALARLAAEGSLRVAERPPSPYGRSPLKSRAGLAKTLLDADRGE